MRGASEACWPWGHPLRSLPCPRCPRIVTGQVGQLQCGHRMHQGQRIYTVVRDLFDNFTIFHKKYSRRLSTIASELMHVYRCLFHIQMATFFAVETVVDLLKSLANWQTYSSLNRGTPKERITELINVKFLIFIKHNFNVSESIYRPNLHGFS